MLHKAEGRRCRPFCVMRRGGSGQGITWRPLVGELSPQVTEGFCENPFPLVSLGYFPFQGQQG